MKKITLLISVLFVSLAFAKAQDNVKKAPQGFDTERAGIPHGKIDSVTYSSKTVGTERKALVYTPPSFSKGKKYPVLFLLHGIGGDEKEWL